MTATPVFLVVGTGSIARRHLGNLRSLFPGVDIACVSASGRELQSGEAGAGIEVIPSLTAALERRPALAVIASAAPAHVEQAAMLLEAGVPVFIEKPLADSLAAFEAKAGTLRAYRDRIDVGYNLRYLPAAQKLKRLLDDRLLGRVYSVAVEAGQYLPDWRPASDYRAGVSARRELGGGALLELSHELDYLLWLFGTFDTAYCVATNSGTFDIDVEDRVDALLKRRDGFTARIHLDFLQRTALRSCRVIGENGTLTWDLIGNSITLSGPGNREQVLFSDRAWDRNTMYLEELRRFVQVARGELAPAVGLEQGVAVLALVDALRRSAESDLVVSTGAIRI